MKKILKPVFTKEEIEEEKRDLSIGYKHTELLPGPDLSKPFKNVYERARQKVVEKINGTDKKRDAHAEINSFGWAKYVSGGYGSPSKIYFGIKFVKHNFRNARLDKIIEKYRQLLGYLLQTAGWKNISQDDGNYVITLDNERDINNLYDLSPSIGFYYKGGRPDAEDLSIQSAKVRAETAKKHSGQLSIRRGR